MIPWLNPNDPFPPLDSALREPNGLLAAGGDLSPQRLIAAYTRGIFPWFNPGDPILWWSPDPRMVLFPGELKISRSLQKTLKKSRRVPVHSPSPQPSPAGGEGVIYEVRFDTAFQQVMEACAAPRDEHGGTWIAPAMIAAYTELHRQGLAHSVECWMDNQLAGGLYGVSLGRMFYGESMFSRATDASKIAFVHLVKQLETWGYGMIDCQMKTAHLASFGAREIPRAEFCQRLTKLVHFPVDTGHWRHP